MATILYRLRCRLRSRWKTTFGLAAVVAIAGGVVLTLVAGAARTLSAPDRYSSWRGDRYDAMIEQDHGPPRTAELEALPAVAAIESATFVFGSLTRHTDDEPVEVLVFAGTQTAFGTRLVEGREPDPSAPGEFVATRSFLDGTRSSLGDQFTLATIAQGQADERGFDVTEPEGPSLTAALVGVIDGPSELQEGYPLALFPSTLLGLGDVGISATISVVSVASGATVTDLRAELDGLPDGDTFGIDQMEWVPSEVSAAVTTQGQGLAILAAIVGAATIVVVGQLLSRQVRLTEAQRLALGSIGMTRNQVVADPLLGASVPVALGVVGAVALALIASDRFPAGFAGRVEPHPGWRFEPLVHGPGAVVLAVLLLAWVLTALAVGDRLRHRLLAPGLVDVLAHRMGPAQASTALRFAFSRHPRDTSGPRGPVVGMVAVIGVLVGALTFGASLGRLVDDPARWGNNFDLGLGAGGGALPAEVVQLLETDPDVAALALFGTIFVSVGSDSFDVTGVQPVLGSITPDVLAGRLPQGDDEIVLGRVAARRLGIGPGDDVEIVGAAGSRTLHVSGLAVLPGVEGADGVGEGGLVTFAGLRRIDPSAALTAAGITLRPDAPPDTAARISASTGMGLGQFDRPGVILNLARVRSIPFVVAVTLAALALLSLAHQLILSVQRRRRDFAILRALGGDTRWVTGVVHWQATLFTMIVLALATPLGIFAGLVVYRAYVDQIGVRNTVTLPIGMLGITVLGLLLLANVVAALNALRARRVSPADALAGE